MLPLSTFIHYDQTYSSCYNAKLTLAWAKISRAISAPSFMDMCLFGLLAFTKGLIGLPKVMVLRGHKGYHMGHFLHT